MSSDGKTKTNQTEIIGYLNQIDKIFSEKYSDPKILLKLKKLVVETITWIDNHFTTIENSISLQLLEFLHYFHKTHDFNQLFQDYRIGYLISNNIAYFV